MGLGLSAFNLQTKHGEVALMDTFRALIAEKAVVPEPPTPPHYKNFFEVRARGWAIR
jgi:hypothetical protein